VKPASGLVWGIVLLVASGCAGASPRAQLGGMPETMCKHCNCLMPAGIDPEAMCPVCECGLKARQCVRGH